MSLATLTDSGRTGMAIGLAALPMHFAWGSGSEEWENGKNYLQETLVYKTGLENELGRRTVTSVGFAAPDEQGDIVIPVGKNDDTGEVLVRRYRTSLEPTSYLHMRVNMDFGDTSGAVVREIAIFLNTKVREDLPSGQRLFKPSDIVDKGRLFVVQRLEEFLRRSSSERPTFEFVLPI